MAARRLQLEDRPANSRFGTTRWSVVLRAGVADPSDERRRALGDLVDTYWYPLYAFARRRGNSAHDAMDLTQGFFAQLLAGDGLETVSPEKGRFRSFLLAAFTNYMANQRRAGNAIRRGGGDVTVSLNAEELEARYAREPADHRTPETAYLRNWVQALLQRVRDRLAEDYRRAGKAEFFELLEPHLTRTSDARRAPTPARSLA